MAKRRRTSAQITWTWRGLLLLILFLLLAWALREWAGIDLLGGEAGETVSTDWIAIHFTTPLYPDDPALHTGSIDLRLVDLIDAAQQEVNVAAFQLNLPTVTDALLRAHRRGVRVRLVTDGEYADEEMVKQLQRAGVPVTIRPEGGGLMHNKFVVVDGAWVWTGSWNLTENCTYRNNNNAVLIASRTLAANYNTEFEELFAGKFGPTSPANTPTPSFLIEVPEKGIRVPVEVYFAPEDEVASHLIPLLRSARQSVRFLAFSFTSSSIADTLIDLHRRGISVQGVVERRGSEDSYAQYGRLREAGIQVLQDGNPYIMHHKVFIVDDAAVALGSYNFTGSAEKSNDENLLILHSPEVAAAYRAEFERIWGQAKRE
ncbi:MAG: phospholipase D-like domain-containing protein [Anaerolineae bacterium]|nr:phospholipase D-like domain-containing protein [Anaerolineae bacterium]MDW7991935.1 phospholipase D-like domain-containing protein [Anaerolineae bacterium]